MMRARLRRGGGRKIVALGLILLSVLICAAAATIHLGPMIVELALATATDDITIAVNETVVEVMEDGGLGYDSLVRLEKDSQGCVTALITNTAGINLLHAKITNAIVERFANTDITRVSIPLGSILGGAVFSGRGPRIPVDILSITNVDTSFRNEFSSAGINQTRHQIILDVDVTLGILLPGETGTDRVLTEVSIAETVIVGGVPGTYAEL